MRTVILRRHVSPMEAKMRGFRCTTPNNTSSYPVPSKLVRLRDIPLRCSSSQEPGVFRRRGELWVAILGAARGLLCQERGVARTAYTVP
jgi:hypothetical protein